VHAAHEALGTFGDTQLEMLRHAFVLMAGGDTAEVGLLPHQLRELVVMAGFDPTDAATRDLLVRFGQCG